MSEVSLVRELSPALGEIAAGVRWVQEQAPAWVDPFVIDTGLTEALTNAVVHGVLGVSSAGRQEDVTVYLEELEARAERVDPTIRPLKLALSRSPDSFTVALSWTGLPCPEENRGPRALASPFAGSGLGTTLIHATFDEVQWSPDGCSVRLRLVRPSESSRNPSATEQHGS